MRTPWLVVIVVLIHAVAIGSVMFIQGCGTQRATTSEPPPAPVMPPRMDMAVTPAPAPVFQPPVPVESAPSMMVPSEGKMYVVQKGDSLSKIAVKVGVGARELAQLNNIKDVNRIRVGQKIILPDHAQAVAQAVEKKPAAPARAEKATVAEGGVYVVQAGDNLSKIAQKHGVKLSALRDANQLKGDRILVGQKLMIPGEGSKPVAAKPAAPARAEKRPPVTEEPRTVVAPVAPAVQPVPVAPAPAASVTAPQASEPQLGTQGQPLDYTVQDGDTLESIAKLFIVRKEDIMTLNSIGDAGVPLSAGQKLKIPPSEF